MTAKAVDRGGQSHVHDLPAHPNDTTLARPDWTVTLFSFTTEIVTAHRTPDELLASVADAGLARRVEIDSPQHFASFPTISPAEAAQTRRVADEHGIGLTMLGVYNDAGLRFPTLLSPAESVAYLRPQLEAAAQLGCPHVRTMFGLDPAVAERLAPVAAEVGVKVLQEVQGGAEPNGAEFERQRSTIARVGGDSLGFVFDLSACMPMLPLTYLEALRRLGVPGPVVAYLDDAWTTEALGLIRSRLDSLLADVALSPAAAVRLAMPFGRFGRSAVADWADALDEFDVLHLKYWDLEDDDGRVSRPVADARREFGSRGFTGNVVSEWGGHEWFELDEANGTDMTRGHRALYDAAL